MEFLRPTGLYGSSGFCLTEPSAVFAHNLMRMARLHPKRA